MAIERKIVEIKRNNCYKEESRQDQMVQCPWDGDIDNKYLPTWEVLSEENIFLNGSPVNI